MKDYLVRPEVMRQAKKDHRGYPWYGEMGIFFLIFLIGNVLEIIAMIPFEGILLFQNETYLKGMQSMDMDLITQASLEVTQSDVFLVLSLFSFAVLILTAFLFGKWIDKRKIASYGFRKKGMLAEYAIGIAVGFVIFSLAIGICLVTGSLKMTLQVGSPLMILLFFLGFLVQGMGEEVLCRGLLMVSLSRRYSVLAAIIGNSLVFAALHLGNSGIGILPLINLFLFGVMASVYFIKRGSIWGVAAIHSVWNFVQGNFYGIRVSGMEMSASVFTSEVLTGTKNRLFNGGDFGLEGGLAVTIVLVIGTVIFWMMPEKDSEKAPEETVETAIQEVADGADKAAVAEKTES